MAQESLAKLGNRPKHAPIFITHNINKSSSLLQLHEPPNGLVKRRRRARPASKKMLEDKMEENKTCEMNDCFDKPNVLSVACLIMLFGLIIIGFFLTSCTLSFQNISTHGVAEDLVDETQRADADVKPVITVPSPSPLG